MKQVGESKGVSRLIIQRTMWNAINVTKNHCSYRKDLINNILNKLANPMKICSQTSNTSEHKCIFQHKQSQARRASLTADRANAYAMVMYKWASLTYDSIMLPNASNAKPKTYSKTITLIIKSMLYVNMIITKVAKKPQSDLQSIKLTVKREKYHASCTRKIGAYESCSAD